jgi:hypothetical protein
MLLRVLNAYTDSNHYQFNQFCRQNYLSKPALTMIGGIRRQLFMELKRLRILPHDVIDTDAPDYNQFSNSWPMIQGVIIAGSYPGVAFIRSGSKLRKIHTIIPNSTLATLHPSSSLRRQVNKNRSDDNSAGDVEPNIECLVYQELAKIDEGLTVSADPDFSKYKLLLVALRNGDSSTLYHVVFGPDPRSEICCR